MEKYLKEIKQRIDIAEKNYSDEVPEYIEALKAAYKALEKQVQRKPLPMKHELIIFDGWRFRCPACGCAVGQNINDLSAYSDERDYCENCGQAIDWED